ncbi:MAG: ubiquinone/menaquinone biosynthesis methyltransferase [Chitinophagales bacterium]|nr:ubiquinone/menaquinone biosynthesis methyltransferase [Chitinophagales bacterium]MDW8418484.1 ubiquinone/menaquinone biosynthesis methyltransferase [Chitinophagales bacterium]
MTQAGTWIHNKTEVPRAFDRIASRYDLATGMSQGYQYDLEESVRRMHLSGKEHVLDLCCGTGKSTLACLRYLPEGRVTGVDNSEGMLAVAAEKLRHELEQGRVRLSQQDAMQLTFDDQSFDAVFMAYGLRNMPDYEKSVREIHRVLKPGGKLCIHDYSLADHPLAKIYWAALGYGFIVPFCTLITGTAGIYLYLIKSVMQFLRPSEIQNLLEQNGFTDVSIQPHAGWRKPILHSVIATKR